jgi:hypothetical protein
MGVTGLEPERHVMAKTAEIATALQMALQIALADPEKRAALLKALGLG